ncbi:tetratricopeptide repeat protein [Flavobacterium rakeshii]|uniref:Tetratricopeptide repeat protein n=1 Tax=Flavobacterium rakeshii TaxID=1038845 RepID=A0A6N8HH53_9FLAO|nr:tetratricopeptide repeat protein [Flavobacterium rakeshii]MUV04986.1 tetratricopeptide repeat protein [Flavobacterium rakeshii]
MKKVILLIIVAALLYNCGSDLSYEEQLKNYTSLVKKADSISLAKDYKKAEDYATKAIEITDTLAPALLSRGNIRLKLKKWDESIDDFDKVIEIEGNKSLAHKGLAIAKLASDDEDDFLESINIYLNYHNSDVQSHELRAEYYSKNDYNKAIEDYSYCINAVPLNSSYYLKRGNLYTLNNQEKLGIKDYQSYIQLNPNKNNDEILYKRGTLNLKVNKPKEAVIDFLKIENPNSRPLTFSLLGDSYYQLGNYHEAIKFYSTYIRLFPSASDIIEKRGLSFQKMGELNKAESDIKKSAMLKWKNKGFFQKYWLFILYLIFFAMTYIIISIFNTEEYDGRKAKKAYMFFFVTGIVGGHYLYVKSYIRYTLYFILLSVLVYNSIYSIISFYNYKYILWNDILDVGKNKYILYIIVILFGLDLLSLSYLVYSSNQKVRFSVSKDLPEKRQQEITDLETATKQIKRNLQILDV